MSELTVIVKAEGFEVPWQDLEAVEDVSQEQATEAKGYPHPGNMLRLPGGVLVPMQFDRSPLESRNGLLLTEVLQASVDRLEVFNSPGSPMACRENALARTAIEEAIHWLQHRQLDRQRRGVRFQDKQ